VTARSILVVDDNTDAADMLALILESLGHTVRVAHDGYHALRALDEMSFDVAILDIGLPIMDGYELARRMRSNPTCCGTHLIAHSGYGQPSDRERSARAGFDAHLVKPSSIDALEDVIERLGGRRPLATAV
jgi:CheY-like chemotaxis protein